MTRSDAPKPPEGLDPPALAVWKWVTSTYDLSVADLQVLERAVRALDRARAAEEVLRTEGPTVVNRYGEVRAHPCDEIARANGALYERMLRILNLAPDDAPEPWKARR